MTPNSMLKRTSYFICEHVGMFKLTDTYDILNPETQQKIGQAREEVSGLVKFLRLLINKQLMPTTVNIYEGADENSRKLVVSIKRGITLFRPKVDVVDGAGVPLGYFKTKAFSLGPTFLVYTTDDQEIATIKGDWKGWNFRFMSGETELGLITKKWAGIGKELFTSADNYLISLHGEPDANMNMLLLAGGIAIDTIFKEKK